MKRYGACSLREDGPCFGRPTPLPFASAGAAGSVIEQTQVVDFHYICRYFHVVPALSVRVFNPRFREVSEMALCKSLISMIVSDIPDAPSMRKLKTPHSLRLARALQPNGEGGF
ncbi:MAG TPA: hypothetical protein VGR14_05250 [Verrucomicrobiae bacterium]|jgi:hypothetical protein|nr:hypothetical protein [Verrucomicrobiae bacterium]